MGKSNLKPGDKVRLTRKLWGMTGDDIFPRVGSIGIFQAASNAFSAVDFDDSRFMLLDEEFEPLLSATDEWAELELQ